MKKIHLIILIIALLPACKNESENETVQNVDNTEFSESENIKYADEYLTIFKQFSIYRDSVDFSAYQDSVRSRIKSAGSEEERHEAIEYALDISGDKHAKLKEKGSWKSYSSGDFQLPKIEYKLLKNAVGYIKIPPFSHAGVFEIPFADSIKKVVEKLDQNNLKGWIIDLSDNTGGNSLPMQLGLSPLLDNKTFLHFFDHEKNDYAIRIDQQILYFGVSGELKSDYVYELKNKNKKLAVIINDSTASSGEYLAISLKSYDNFIGYFGSESMGYTTGLNQYFLPDSTELYISHYVLVDVDYRTIKGKIIPDYKSDNPINLAVDKILNN